MLHNGANPIKCFIWEALIMSLFLAVFDNNLDTHEPDRTNSYDPRAGGGPGSNCLLANLIVNLPLHLIARRLIDNIRVPLLGNTPHDRQHSFPLRLENTTSHDFFFKKRPKMRTELRFGRCIFMRFDPNVTRCRQLWATVGLY